MMEPDFTFGLIRVIILLLGVYALSASLYGSLFAKRAPSKAAEKTSEPPTISSRIPYIGHVLQVMRTDFQEYFGRLSVSQATPVSVAQLFTQRIYVVDASDTEMTKLFARTPGLSLTAAFWVGFGGYLHFNKASEESMMTPDKHPFKRELSRLLRDELQTLEKVQKLGAQVQRKINQAWQRTVPDDSNTVKLAEWVSDGIAMSVGSVIWGDKGPYDDPKFRQSLRTMLCGLRRFYHPLTLFLPSSFRRARDHVRAGLSTLDAPRSGDQEEPDCDDLCFIGKVKILLQKYSIPQAGWNDFSFSLIMGVFPNLINITTWALWHLVADDELMAAIRAEVDALVEPSPDPANSQRKKVDVSRVRESCPLLMSFWYELLRLYAANSNITRLVTHDAVFPGGSLLSFRRKALVVAPMLPHQHGRDGWGQDAEVLRADRFLDAEGRVDAGLVRRLMAFGLPTVLMCPGRYVVFNVVMLNIIKTLLTFDIAPARGETLNGGQGVCRPRRSMVAGVPEPSHDPELVLTKRVDVGSVHVTFENQRPGW
ncbi:Cytochrome P450 [Cordyceps fumosorosea ARSEF 2679]|uniref:Cytochrome P450 n=1 Tax=Cordyceps fumosorosea (strain ARSEF 2679) TaxID=1081104 RepID=A0A167S9T5_CORFA|nr:Cytochrome P450 [Cordyceps fumosorosea ARSEF 2679]OAA59406.1 Cytochrome P450 [Cordyceps fumosorosea ARSEF 2679]